MKLTNSAKILLIGGHLTPALAVLEELELQNYHNFVWIGVKHSQTSAKNLSAEYQIINDKQIKFIDFKAGKLWRKWTLKTFWQALYNLIMIPVGIIHAIFILISEKPQLVVSFGGYMAFPIVFAAWLLGINSATHEQTMSMGMANKVIAKFASKILLSWPENQEQLSADLLKKAYVTGNPIRKSLFTVTTDKFNFASADPLLYITGGNQGSNTINWRLFEILPELLNKVNIIHQVGSSSITNDLAKAEAVWQKLDPRLQEKYRYFDNIYGAEISEVFHKADFVLSRSGANSVTDLMALGKLCILIPIPWSAHQEQQKNAEMVAKTGLGFVLKQYDAMPPSELLTTIEIGLNAVKNNQDFLRRPLATAQAEAKQKVQPAAALNIVELITNF